MLFKENFNFFEISVVHTTKLYSIEEVIERLFKSIYLGCEPKRIIGRSYPRLGYFHAFDKNKRKAQEKLGKAIGL